MDHCCTQAKLTPENIAGLSAALDIPASELHNGLGAHWWPNRGLGTTPPTDPVIYRLYEVRVKFCRLEIAIVGVDCLGSP
jgi:cyanate lyase